MKAPKEMNIVFIIVDGLRAKNLSCYGYPKLTSPTIDKIAERGVLFENAYACSNHTDPSFTTMFSGKCPISHGIVHHGFDVTDDEIKELKRTGTIFLPQILKMYGYTTIAVDYLERWHKKGYDFYGIRKKESVRIKHARFDAFLDMVGRCLNKLPHFIYLPIRKMVRSAGLAKDLLRGGVLTDLAIKLLKEKQDKFFLLIHYADVHSPWNTIPKKYIRKFREDEKEKIEIEKMLEKIENKEWREVVRRIHMDGINYVHEISSVYDGAINFIDDEINRLIEFLDREGKLDQTLIIITGDHGTDEIRNGIFIGHHGLYEPSIHVPLIMAYPRGLGLKNGRVKGFVQHTDLLPTILEIIGIDASTFNFDGKSLLPLINENKQMHSSVYVMEATAEQRFCIRTNEYKYICSFSKDNPFDKHKTCGRDIEELYDLKKDLNEEQNIVQERPEIRKKLREKLVEWMEGLQHKKLKRELLVNKIRRLKESDRINTSKNHKQDT